MHGSIAEVLEDPPMHSIAERLYQEAIVGSTIALPKAGTRLENRYVFDAAAREVKAMAERGLVEIVTEHRIGVHESSLITEIVFVKLR
jgi:hypothetical protein